VKPVEPQTRRGFKKTSSETKKALSVIRFSIVIAMILVIAKIAIPRLQRLRQAAKDAAPVADGAAPIGDYEASLCSLEFQRLHPAKLG
jgi:hypothetical protein